MAEYDLKKSIPRENFNIQENIFNRPSLTNPKMIVVGDPYINFTKNEKTRRKNKISTKGARGKNRKAN